VAVATVQVGGEDVDAVGGTAYEEPYIMPTATMGTPSLFWSLVVGAVLGVVLAGGDQVPTVTT